MKLYKRLAALSLVLALALGLVSCSPGGNEEQPGSESPSAGSETQVGDEEKKLVVYTSTTDAQTNAIVGLFTEKYGIDVEIINGSTGELLARANSESASPYGDVMFGGGESSYTQYRDIFMDYVSSEDPNLIEKFRNTTGWCTNYYLAATTLLVNTDLIGDIEVTGYADLLNEALKGKIATADMATSSSAFMHLETILTVLGGFESEEAWEYIRQLLVNLDGKISSGSSNVWKSVADGEMTVGMTYEEAAVALKIDGAPIEIIYPEEGCLVDSTVAAIFKDCPHPENAKLFIDFMLSKEVQQVLCQDVNLRPVRDDIEYPEYFVPSSDITSIDLDQDYVNEHKQDLIEKYQEIYADVF